jgi:hypothetical protein
VIVAEVRRIASEQSASRIDEAVAAFERDRTNLLGVQGQDDGEIMSHLLVAQFVRVRMDRGNDLNAALREYAQRVKAIFPPVGRKSGGAVGGAP